ncbi:MAG: hypothetical protein ACREO4_06350 [Lysobacter sp.]
MAWIDEQWLRMALDAMRDTFGNDPHLKRDMIQFLFDEGFWDAKTLSWDAAVARFNGCLNPNKSEFFKTGELWALMKRFDRHQLFLAMATDLGYEVRRIPTDERRQQLLERIAVAYEGCERSVAGAAAELSRLAAPAPAPKQGAVALVPGQPLRFSYGLDPAQGLPAAMGCP